MTTDSVKTVIVADDTAFVRDRFIAALVEAGHRAIGADSASALLARVRQTGEEIDLIVLDLRLPSARGVDLVRAVRQIDAGRIPILVFSGTIASADEVRELRALGVSGYINEYCAPPNILPGLAPHLFPDSFNRRSSVRSNVGLPIWYRLGHAISSALTLNLGKGGLGVRTMTPSERGAVLKLRFRLPGQPRDIEADGRVCWTDRNLGMGIQFEQLTATDQASIDEFIDGHVSSNRKA